MKSGCCGGFLVDPQAFAVSLSSQSFQISVLFCLFLVSTTLAWMILFKKKLDDLSLAARTAFSNGQAVAGTSLQPLIGRQLSNPLPVTLTSNVFFPRSNFFPLLVSFWVLSHFASLSCPVSLETCLRSSHLCGCWGPLPR